MKLSWLTQGSFLFDYAETGGPRILVDPYMSDCLEAKGLKRLLPFPLQLADLCPDMLICTHDHLDHLDPETVQKIAACYPDCILAGPASCIKHFQRLAVAEKRCRLMQRGKSFAFQNVRITPVHAYHSDPDALGIVLTAVEAKGKKIYLTGDTLYGDLLFNQATAGCDLALACINGRLGNMTLAEALRVVQRLKPAAALPMHFGLFAENTADPQPFVDGCKAAGIDSWVMIPGRAYPVTASASRKQSRGAMDTI